MNTQAWTVAPRAAASPAPCSVFLPFTSPLLAGTRARAQDGVIDYILPNPSGGRGAYVVSWAQAAELGTPTLHDAVLARRLLELPVLSPAGVRDVARDVAAEGYAGRAAANAALRARAQRDAQTLRLRCMFMLALIKQSDMSPAEQAQVATDLDGTIAGGRAFDAVATKLGWQPPVLLDALDRLSAAYLFVAAGGRAERLLGMMRRLHGSLQSCSAGAESQPQAAVSSRTVSAVACALRQAQTTFADAARALSAPALLLDQWRDDPVSALSGVRTLDEALDSWDRICLLWFEARTSAEQQQVLPEVALLVKLTGISSADIEQIVVARGRNLPDTAPPSGTSTRDPWRAEKDLAAPGNNLIERNELVRTHELRLEQQDGD